MTSLPEGLSVAGVHVVPADGDPSTFYYFPARPGVARDFRGNAEFSWVEPLSLLNVTTRLQVDAAVEETIRQAERLAQGRVRLVPAPLSVTRVSLLLEPPGAEPRPVGDGSRSSGMPPFQAAHAARLVPADAAVVQAAIREGRELPVSAVYEGVLRLPRIAEVTCSVVGDVTADVQALAGGEVTPAAARARVEAGIARGRLRKETAVAGTPPAEMRGEVEDEAVRGAAEIVRALARAHAAAHPPTPPADLPGVEPEPGPEPLPFGALGGILSGFPWPGASTSRTRTTSRVEFTSGAAHSGATEGEGPEPADGASPPPGEGRWVLRAEAGNVHARRVADTREIEVRCAGPLGLRVGPAAR
jgi:hypothetical protein